MTRADVTAVSRPPTAAEEMLTVLLAGVPGLADDLDTFAAMVEAMEEADSRVRAREAEATARLRRSAFRLVPVGA